LRNAQLRQMSGFDPAKGADGAPRPSLSPTRAIAF